MGRVVDGKRDLWSDYVMIKKLFQRIAERLKAGDEEYILNCLEWKATGKKPAHWDIAPDDQIRKFIEDNSVDVNQPRENGQTLLGTAAQFGEADLCTFLMDLGADPNIVYTRARDNRQSCAVREAALSIYGYFAVRALLDGGADPHLLDETEGPLIDQVQHIIDVRSEGRTEPDDPLAFTKALRILQEYDGVAPEPEPIENPNLIQRLLDIGAVPKITDGAYEERFFWLPPGDGVGPFKQWDPEVREIGESLYRLGNRTLEAMQLAHRFVVDRLGPAAGHALSAQWHDIGADDPDGETWMH